MYEEFNNYLRAKQECSRKSWHSSEGNAPAQPSKKGLAKGSLQYTSDEKEEQHPLMQS